MTPIQKDLAIQRCLAKLRWARANPEVGMGPLTNPIVAEVVLEMTMEANIYNGTFCINKQERTDLTLKVQELRQKENL